MCGGIVINVTRCTENQDKIPVCPREFFAAERRGLSAACHLFYTDGRFASGWVTSFNGLCLGSSYRFTKSSSLRSVKLSAFSARSRIRRMRSC